MGREITQKKRQEVFEMFDGRCAYCGCKLDRRLFECDHFLAVVRGGKIKDNLVPACADCNALKGRLTIKDFRKKLSDGIVKDFHKRLLKKYYGIEYEAKEIEFYYEKENKFSYLKSEII